MNKWLCIDSARAGRVYYVTLLFRNRLQQRQQPQLPVCKYNHESWMMQLLPLMEVPYLPSTVGTFRILITRCSLGSRACLTCGREFSSQLPLFSPPALRSFPLHTSLTTVPVFAC